MEEYIKECNHEWVGCRCALCGETRWLIPVEGYDFKFMDHDELKEVAIKMIDVLEDKHFEITNYHDLVENLIKYLHPSDEEFLDYAKMKVKDYYEEGSEEYLLWTNKLVEFWKSLEIEPPIIDFIYDDSDQIVTKRKGIISNRTGYRLKNPTQWKELVKSIK